MKVMFYGNAGNIGFRMVKWLRAKGHQAVLFIPRGETHERSLPEWEDPSLKSNYPEWIHEFEDTAYDKLNSPRWILSKIWFYLRHKKKVYFSSNCPTIISKGSGLMILTS